VPDEVLMQVVRNGRLHSFGGPVVDGPDLPIAVGEYLWQAIREAFHVLGPDVLAAAVCCAISDEVENPLIEWESPGADYTHAERVHLSQAGLALVDALSDLGVDIHFESH
jgi:hypothetical protein